jgi:outer membrane biosynthesis protein TonB
MGLQVYDVEIGGNKTRMQLSESDAAVMGVADQLPIPGTETLDTPPEPAPQPQPQPTSEPAPQPAPKPAPEPAPEPAAPEPDVNTKARTAVLNKGRAG